MLTNYQIMYLVTSLFGSYTIYKFMKLFYSNRKTSRGVEILSYLVYNITISVMHFLINIPIVLGITNIIAFILISFNYKTTYQKRCLSSIYIFLILMVIEVIVGVSMGYLGISIINHSEFNNGFSLIIVRILSYMVVLLLGRYKNIKLGYEISILNWIAVIIIPLISVYIIILMFQAERLHIIEVEMAIIGLFIINILVFYLYDNFQLQAAKEIERKLLLQQNKYYDNQFELIQSSKEAMRRLRHDWDNHLAVLHTLLKKEDHLNAEKYLEEIKKRNENIYDYVNTGNMQFDSILNFKIKDALNKGILTNVDIKIPEVIKMNAYDITTILGNLLDNAIEANKKIKNKKININIKYTKGRLFIDISNPINDNLIWEKGFPKTSKKNKKNHGIGLKHVRRTIEKYNGDMEIVIDENIFTIFIFIYV